MIKELLMNGTHEKSPAWTKKTPDTIEHFTRWDRAVGREGGTTGDKQERTCRKDSSRSNFFGGRCSTTGGIIRQLIDVIVDQLAFKRCEIQRLEEEKQRVDIEIRQLDTKVQGFYFLLQQLETNKDT